MLLNVFHVILQLIIAIEDDYVGPQLENGKVTLKFMEELMEFYKDQKRLHRKFAYKVWKWKFNVKITENHAFCFETCRFCAISIPISVNNHHWLTSMYRKMLNSLFVVIFMGNSMI